MHEDDIDNDDIDDDEPGDDLPVFNVTELRRLTDAGKTNLGGEIAIEERIIVNLAEILGVVNKDNRPLSIEECVLEEAHIDQIGSANVDISIDESVFVQKVHFRNGVFFGKLSLWDTTFKEGADFSGAVFKEELMFEGCIFHKEVTFSDAVFEKRAMFISCDFEGKTSFDSAAFAGEVDFSGSTFQKSVTYKDALFEKVVNLSEVHFAEGLQAIGSNLADMKKEPPAQQTGQEKKYGESVKQRTGFNPLRKLNGASKKTTTRRQFLRGIFRFLPQDKEK